MLKIGIAGFGKMGKIRAREIIRHPDTTLIAYFEQLNEISSKEFENVMVCKSFEELISLDLDAIFICAFNDVASDYTARALAQGLHVFCEKPPARNSEELDIVISVEKESGRTLKYGFNHRYHYSVMEAKRMIDSKKMGKLLWMRGVYGKAGSIDYHKNWRNYKKYSGGGILMDQGIHMLDLMCLFNDSDFDVVSATLSSSYWDIEVEDNAFVTLEKNGVIATLHSSATQWRHKFLLEMCFEEGFINLEGILSSTHSYAPECLIVGRREFEDITFAMGKPKEERVWFENDDSWKFELEDFVKSIRSSSKIDNGNSSDAKRALSLVERIYSKSGYYS